jgi:hypothetical protein
MLTVDESWVNVQQKTFTKWSVHPKAILSQLMPVCSPASPMFSELANLIAFVLYGSCPADFTF